MALCFLEEGAMQKLSLKQLCTAADLFAIALAELAARVRSAAGKGGGPPSSPPSGCSVGDDPPQMLCLCLDLGPAWVLIQLAAAILGQWICVNLADPASVPPTRTIAIADQASPTCFTHCHVPFEIYALRLC
jgi:hypothetical protein